MLTVRPLDLGFTFFEQFVLSILVSMTFQNGMIESFDKRIVNCPQSLI